MIPAQDRKAVKVRLKTRLLEKPWTTLDEDDFAHAFFRSMGRMLRDHGVAENPLVLLRVDDILVAYLLARRSEARLGGEGQEGDKASVSAIIESVGKTRERLRKAMKELEELCGRPGAALDAGVAEAVQPLLEKAEGVLQKALKAGPPPTDRETGGQEDGSTL